MSDHFRFDARSDGEPSDDEVADPDPWAPGGSMANAPIPPAARAFEQPVDDDRPRRPAATESGPPRNTRLAIAGALGAVLLVAALWVAGRDEPDDAAPSPTDVTGTIADAVEEDEPAPESTEVRPPTEVLTGATEVVVPVPQPLPPAAVAGLPATEVVVLAENGTVRLIDTVAATQTILGEFAFADGSSMAATDDTVIVWSDGVAEVIFVLRRDQPALTFESGVPVADAIAQPDGEYLLVAAGDIAQTRELRIDTVVRTTEVDFAIGDPGVAQAHPSGDLMVTTDEGVHLLGAGGPTLLSTGVVVAATDRYVLYEECAAGAGCRLIREDAESGERGDVALDPEPLTASATRRVLSPDGTALVEIGTVEQPFRVRILEIEAGTALDVQTDGEISSVSWAPDGSAFFGVVNGELVVVDRATGETTPFANDGDPVRAVVARPAPEPARGAAEAGERTVLAVLTDLTGIDLVAYTRDAELLDIDIDSRVYTGRPGLPFESGAPLDVLPGPGAVTVTSWDGAGAFLAGDAGDVVVIDALSPGGPLLPGPVPGTAWRFADSAGSATSLEVVDVAGERVGPVVEFDQFVSVMADANGALLVDAPGGVYLADGTSVVRQTSGELVAAGAATLYARECDEVFVCEVVRIDRATGERSTPPVAELANVPSTSNRSFGSTGASVSPDGDVLLVQTSANSLGWSMIDVAAGTVLGVPGPAVSSPVVWSDDSRYAVYLSGERLRVFDRDASQLKELGQVPAVLAFAEAFDDGSESDGEAIEDGGAVEGVSRAPARRAPTR